MKKKGISLIVLVITIVVMIILAGVVILGLTNNNPIEKAREATFKTDISVFKEELASAIAKLRSEDKNFDPEELNESELEGIRKYVPSFKDSYVGRVEIIEGELVFIGEMGDQAEWAQDVIPVDPSVAPSTDNIPNGYIPIYTAEEFMKIGSEETISIKSKSYHMTKAANYILMSDIDLAGQKNKEIKEFSGILDGNNKTLRNYVSDSCRTNNILTTEIYKNALAERTGVSMDIINKVFVEWTTDVTPNQQLNAAIDKKAAEMGVTRDTYKLLLVKELSGKEPTDTIPALFGNVTRGSEIKNLKLDNFDINGAVLVSALVQINEGNLDHITLTNTKINGKQYVGGIVAGSIGGRLENSNAKVEFASSLGEQQYVGAVSGFTDATVVNNVKGKAEHVANYSAKVEGGAIGFATNSTLYEVNGELTFDYKNLSATSWDFGGTVGFASNCKVTKCDGVIMVSDVGTTVSAKYVESIGGLAGAISDNSVAKESNGQSILKISNGMMIGGAVGLLPFTIYDTPDGVILRDVKGECIVNESDFGSYINVIGGAIGEIQSKNLHLYKAPSETDPNTIKLYNVSGKLKGNITSGSRGPVSFGGAIGATDVVFIKGLNAELDFSMPNYNCRNFGGAVGWSNRSIINDIKVTGKLIAKGYLAGQITGTANDTQIVNAYSNLDYTLNGSDSCGAAFGRVYSLELNKFFPTRLENILIEGKANILNSNYYGGVAGYYEMVEPSSIIFKNICNNQQTTFANTTIASRAGSVMGACKGNSGTCVVENVYSAKDKLNLNKIIGAGAGHVAFNNASIFNTTTEMKNANFNGWDANFWNVSAGNIVTAK